MQLVAAIESVQHSPGLHACLLAVQKVACQQLLQQQQQRHHQHVA
jgi:hypothetical protein